MTICSPKKIQPRFDKKTPILKMQAREGQPGIACSEARYRKNRYSLYHRTFFSKTFSTIHKKYDKHHERDGGDVPGLFYHPGTGG
jgi:hypothetical protein